MKGDFSSFTFDPRKQFRCVRQQQGRVELDADWNEQAAIFLHYLERLAADLIGPFGGPVGDLGFAITTRTGNPPDLNIGAGRYYVGGVLAENLAQDAHYLGQAFLQDSDKLPGVPFLAYLDVWERHVSYLEDDSIREVALDGPDTASRGQLVWQVRVTDKAPGQQFPTKPEEVDKIWPDWVKLFRPPASGSLVARAKPSGDPTSPCVASPDARYRGLENQLYRVEIHTPGTAAAGATFKWSRDNGSVAFAIVDLATDSASKTTTVTLERLGQDDRQSLAQDDWVEIVDDHVVLGTGKGSLLQVATPPDVERAQVTLRGLPDTKAGQDKTLHPLLRRWDYGRATGATGARPAADGALPIVEGIPIVEGKDKWIDLEDGIEVSFQPALDKQPAQVYATGDYWLIPARTATGDIVWPGEPTAPEALPPQGIVHRFAPLALLLAGGPVELRKSFKTLAVPVT